MKNSAVCKRIEKGVTENEKKWKQFVVCNLICDAFYIDGYLCINMLNEHELKNVDKVCDNGNS